MAVRDSFLFAPHEPVSDMRAEALRCDYLTNPLGIDDPAPRLSWELAAQGRDRRQSAYRLLVATRPEYLRAGTADLWDSGIVTSDQMAQVAYAGKTLHSQQRCWWTVQVWDEHGLAGSPSEMAWWEMGLLAASDWQAQWIGLPDRPRAPHPTRALFAAPYLRATFTARPGLQQARLYATARGVYAASLNGARISDTVLAPGWTEYAQRLLYQTYDVTASVQAGENVLGVIVGDGWYSGHIGYLGNRDTYGATPAFHAQLHLTYDDGTTSVVTTNETWHGAFGPICYSDLLHGEYFDARRGLGAWNQPAYDARDWQSVTTWERQPSPQLCADGAEPVRVTQTLSPQRLIPLADGRIIADFGQNLAGWVRLRAQGPAGTVIRLRYAEMLQPDGELYRVALRSAEATDTFILGGHGDEEFTPHFTFHGFRYCEITGYPGELAPDAITACVLESDTTLAGTFTCSHPLVNQLYQNVVWGQRGNFLSVPTDCPQRDERLGWLGDAQIFARTATFNRDVAAFFTRWLDTVADAQFPNGAYPDVAPRVVVDAEGAPAWGDAGVILPWTLYRVYGDTRIIARHWAAMTEWMTYLAAASPDHLRTERLNNNYGDWLAVDDATAEHAVATLTPKEVLATAYYAYDAHLMAQMARALGHDADALHYEHLFAQIKAAFQQAYVDAEGHIAGATQTAYVLALQMDLMPEALRPVVAQHLVEDIERRGGHLATGFVGVSYLLPMLTATGHADVAYRLLLNETYPSWGYSIRQGATTIWERWDGWTEERGFQDPEMNSFNHYSLGSVAEWLFRTVAGIDSGATPGYRHIRIAPRPDASLTHAAATYHSISGTIAVAWETTATGLTLNVTIPVNTTAEIVLPVADAAQITESGTPLSQLPATWAARSDGASVSVTVGSGTYHFAAQHQEAAVISATLPRTDAAQ